jgi:hypothetical protein
MPPLEDFEEDERDIVSVCFFKILFRFLFFSSWAEFEEKYWLFGYPDSFFSLDQQRRDLSERPLLLNSSRKKEKAAGSLFLPNSRERQGEAEANLFSLNSKERPGEAEVNLFSRTS